MPTSPAEGCQCSRRIATSRPVPCVPCRNATIVRELQELDGAWRRPHDALAEFTRILHQFDAPEKPTND